MREIQENRKTDYTNSLDLSLSSENKKMALVLTNNLKWRRGLVVTTTVQLHSIKPELRYRADPACGMSEI